MVKAKRVMRGHYRVRSPSQKDIGRYERFPVTLGTQGLEGLRGEVLGGFVCLVFALFFQSLFLKILELAKENLSSCKISKLGSLSSSKRKI